MSFLSVFQTVKANQWLKSSTEYIGSILNSNDLSAGGYTGDQGGYCNRLGVYYYSALRVEKIQSSQTMTTGSSFALKVTFEPGRQSGDLVFSIS